MTKRMRVLLAVLAALAVIAIVVVPRVIELRPAPGVARTHGVRDAPRRRRSQRSQAVRPLERAEGRARRRDEVRRPLPRRVHRRAHDEHRRAGARSPGRIAAHERVGGDAPQHRPARRRHGLAHLHDDQVLRPHDLRVREVARRHRRQEPSTRACSPMSPASTKRSRSSARSRTSSPIRRASSRSAPRSRRACCSTARPAPARRCWRARSRAKRVFRSSRCREATSSRCSRASAPRVCATSSRTRRLRVARSSSSTRSTPSDGSAVPASVAATTNASRR